MKKLIFDLDNTLLFISDDWGKCYQKFIDKYNLGISPEELYNVVGKFEEDNRNMIVTPQYFIEYINNISNLNLTLESLKDLSGYYDDIELVKTDIIYDLLEYLSSKYEIYAYTNWFTENQLNRLRKYNLDKFFNEVYGWDKVYMKPSIMGIKNIVKDNIKDYIFIGDSIEYDIEVPSSMGMDVIFYNRKGIKQDKYKEVLKIEDLKNIL